MSTRSLKDRIEELQRDITSDPMRITSYSDFPFTIFRYEPDKEWEIRKELCLLKTRIENVGKNVHLWSMADLLWQSLAEEQAIDDVILLEKDRGFQYAQSQITTYATDEDFTPIHSIMAEKYKKLDSEKDLVFIWRIGSLSPNILRVSGLLERLHSSRIKLVPTILFYPGGWKGGTLNFMNIRNDFEPIGSYRVKVYGRET